VVVVEALFVFLLKVNLLLLVYWHSARTNPHGNLSFNPHVHQLILHN
jgi:hypothetical protein